MLCDGTTLPLCYRQDGREYFWNSSKLADLTDIIWLANFSRLADLADFTEMSDYTKFRLYWLIKTYLESMKKSEVSKHRKEAKKGNYGKMKNP